eukprot:10474831-Heterocapsa_arctica.AAC.1
MSSNAASLPRQRKASRSGRASLPFSFLRLHTSAPLCLPCALVRRSAERRRAARAGAYGCWSRVKRDNDI